MDMDKETYIFGDPERSLSNSEIGMEYRHDMDGTIAIDTNIIFIEGKIIKPEVVQCALVELQKREILLRTKLYKDNSDKYFFKQMTEPIVNLSFSYVSQDSDDWWIDELQKDIEIKFDTENGPLWRCILFINPNNTNEENGKTTLLFSFHHVCFDGGSIMAFFEKFLTLCAEIDQEKLNTDILVNTGIPRPLHELCNHPIYWYSSLKLIIKLIYYYYFNKIATIYSPKDFNSPGYIDNKIPWHTRIYPFTLEQDKLLSLKEKCKTKQVTIHSILSAASILAYTQVYNINYQNKILLTFHSISMRRYCSPIIPRNIFGCFLQPFAACVSIRNSNNQKETLWNIANQIQSQTHNEKLPGILAFFVNLFAKFKAQPMEDKPKDMITLGRATKMPFNISNRGYFSNVDKNFGPFKLASTFWTTNEHISGFPHTHNIVSFGGRLHWSLTYYTQVTSKEQTEIYAKRIQQLLDE